VPTAAMMRRCIRRCCCSGDESTSSTPTTARLRETCTRSTILHVAAVFRYSESCAHTAQRGGGLITSVAVRAEAVRAEEAVGGERARPREGAVERRAGAAPCADHDEKGDLEHRVVRNTRSHRVELRRCPRVPQRERRQGDAEEVRHRSQREVHFLRRYGAHARESHERGAVRAQEAQGLAHGTSKRAAQAPQRSRSSKDGGARTGM
jgi:hypothetical protein